VKGRYISSRQLSKMTKRDFTLTFEEYAELIKNLCRYCGGPLNETGSGLDRIDPTGAYTPDNVVPCCKDCNQTKSASFTYDEMLIIGEAIGRVKAQRKHNCDTNSQLPVAKST